MTICQHKETACHFLYEARSTAGKTQRILKKILGDMEDQAPLGRT